MAKHGKTVKYIHFDNAGENKALKKACLQAGLCIQFDHTTPGTLQQNGRVKCKFAMLYARVWAMLKNHAHLPTSLRKELLGKASANATLVGNVVVRRDRWADSTVCAAVLQKGAKLHSAFVNIWRSWHGLKPPPETQGQVGRPPQLTLPIFGLWRKPCRGLFLHVKLGNTQDYPHPRCNLVGEAL
jgi:hypothetical protein